jgi:nitrite reductase/ring-hydroxylating ferredoxin subunit
VEVEMTDRVVIGTLEELRAAGCLTGKAGTQPVCVFWSDGEPFAVDDRCPHLGFPLHRGTVESGLLTCHWHNARFDLTSGGTLDPWADDVRAYPVSIEGDSVTVLVEPEPDRTGHHLARLDDGLEQGITLVVAKAVLGLLEEGVEAGEVVRAGVAFGTRYREEGWGAGLTVLSAMANVLPHLDPVDRPLALVHGLAHVSRDTRGRPPRFPLAPLEAEVPAARLQAWYRRFVETRSTDAAERTLASAVATLDRREVAGLMFAAATDHVFLDGGHTIDFTNKAFEVLDHLGWAAAGDVLPTLAAQTAAAARSEERGAWRHPHDLAGLVATAGATLADRLAAAGTADGHPPAGPGPGKGSYQAVPAVPREAGAAAPGSGGPGGGSGEVGGNGNGNVVPGQGPVGSGGEPAPAGFDRHRGVTRLAWGILADDPREVVAAVDGAVDAGATPEELGRAVALAAALRITRFHVQNDHGDWDEVHHSFTAANALHQALVRAPTPELVRGVYHNALRVYLDRFLNVPAARLPEVALPPDPAPDLADLQACWDQEGQVDRAGSIVYGYLAAGGDPGPAVAALGHALLNEDAEFHWFQLYEAAVRQFGSWPAGSEEGALILAGAARFLAAHTPTRRELAQVVRIATRLRRGDALFADASA